MKATHQKGNIILQLILIVGLLLFAVMAYNAVEIPNGNPAQVAQPEKVLKNADRIKSWQEAAKPQETQSASTMFYVNDEQISTIGDSQNWIQLTADSNEYTVLFPSKPKVLIASVEKYAQSSYTKDIQYRLETENEIYTVTESNVTDKYKEEFLKVYSPKELLSMELSALIQRFDATLYDSEYIGDAEHPRMKFSMRSASDTTFMKGELIWSSNDIYRVAVHTMDGVEREDHKKFITSFKLK